MDEKDLTAHLIDGMAKIERQLLLSNMLKLASVMEDNDDFHVKGLKKATLGKVMVCIGNDIKEVLTNE